MAPSQMRQWLIRSLALVLLPALFGSAQAARSFITISTGDVTGVYYQAGGGICSLVNAGRQDHQIRCSVASSPGSVENIRALRRGERAFGFAQSDLVQQALSGSGVFADDGAFAGLRTVFALHPESVTLVVQSGSGVESVQDIRGQRVNVGAEGSGQAATMDSLMNALGWTRDDFADAPRLSASEQVDAFCNDNLDVAMFVTGHPNTAVQETLACGGRLVPIEGPAINRLVRSAPYYNTTAIPGGAYDGVSADVATYGVTSLLVSSTNTPQRTVREVTRSVFENVGAFRDWHRAFADLEPAGMARGAGAVEAPLHPGAEMWFRDQDLI